MHLKKYRLLSPDEDNSGTDVAEAPEEEMEPDDTGEPESVEQEPEEASDPAPEEELVIQLDEKEEEDEKAPGWVKDLRKRYREEQKARRQIEEELSRLKGGAKQESDALPPKPTLENPGTGRDEDSYDAEVFQHQLDAWYEKKADHDRKQAQVKAQQDEAAKEWEAVQKRYAEGKSKLPADKMEEAEAEVISVLSPNRQAMLMDIADDAALLAYALGSNPETLRKVGSIKNDARFIKELTKIEMNIKAAPKKAAPPPERTISGSGRTPGATASNLEKLKADAQKSGDYSKYYAEKRRLAK